MRQNAVALALATAGFAEIPRKFIRTLAPKFRRLNPLCSRSAPEKRHLVTELSPCFGSFLPKSE
jgi:hypothetical protein